ncbi:NAD-dependent epimerase/dehydratase family protein [Frondihabitans australicus]|uniref:Nucleoside-diphosphate-sugar epimerase n=1 Tax=Frondihabitans australicus TaxID=386892 RepID=A0A495IIV3_9MICO|nr:NAD-dependent epimerase/dehydratase family protein [Frondihabitans australicus]RKR75952.1 nucleoside-diphosphate-sugar epimerase [Frondihabitans australicus]
MRIFVAGASGVLGCAFLPLALAAGHEVVGMARSSQGAATIEALGGTPVVADAFDREAVTAAVVESRPDVVVNLLTDLGSGTSASNARIRVEAGATLVEAAQAAGSDRVIAESISWVHPPSPETADESTPLDVDSGEPRRTTILAVESLESATLAGPNGVVLRFGQLYGPGTWYARDGRFAELARAGGLPATETVTSFVHAEDAAAAVLLALDWPAGVYDVVDDEPAAGTEWGPVFARAVGAPDPAPSTSGDLGRPVSNAAARALGWAPARRSWREFLGA